MITHLKGRLVEKTPTYAVIECGGIGYLVHISLNTFASLGADESCKLFTHFVVREDAQMLYGFLEEDERVIFRDLISVSGVGANTARMILSAMTPPQVRQAILGGNVTALKAIKGIGAKSAERIIVDLKDKIGSGDLNIEKIYSKGNTIRTEALSALSVLGIDRKKAEKAIDQLFSDGHADLPVEEMIKRVLKVI